LQQIPAHASRDSPSAVFATTGAAFGLPPTLDAAELKTPGTGARAAFSNLAGSRDDRALWRSARSAERRSLDAPSRI